MKIKQKKQLNLPQLIEWAQDNIEEAIKKVYRVNENEVLGDHVRFTEVYSDLGVRLHGHIPLDTTFTVEVEEEITEDAKFENLIYIYANPEGSIYSVVDKNVSINDVKIADYLRTLAFYIMNEDRTLTLIWTKEKGLEE